MFADDAPQDWMSDKAKALLNWCEHNSWFMCPSCHRMEPRSMEPTDISSKNKQLSGKKKCKHCLRNIGYPVPQPDDVPVPLRDLSAAVIDALRPVEVDCGHPVDGSEIRASDGYRVHVDVIRFRWQEESVKHRIRKLDRDDKTKARAALKHLQANEETNYYTKFHKMHEDFLAEFGEKASKQDRRLPMNFMEWVGLENAVWPHLYWTVQMCESYVRSQDTRRLHRPASAHGGPEDRDHRAAAIFAKAEAKREKCKAKAKVQKKPAAGTEESDGSDSDDEVADGGKDKDENEEPDDKEGRQSLKASFVAKVLSPVIGYGTDPDLAQYVYDLWLWSRLGGAKNASGVTMRAALSGNSFSPEYWKTWHAALLDMQKQLGFPTMFLTIAPYEWSFPYHAFMEDEIQKTLMARLWLPGPEALHMAHVLTQCVVGLLTGGNRQSQRADRCWSQHLLGCKDGSGKATVLNYFCRLEFQDGKRKRVFRQAQDYHGRGTVHVHALIWLQNEKTAKLEDVISATLPDPDTPLRAIVEGSQMSWTGSGWRVHDGPSGFNEETGLLELHHEQGDRDAGLRAYMPDVSAALRCHMDVQTSDGRGMLLRYCASYVPKFSDAFASEWLNDQASDFAIARRVLSEYHPLQPEMWLQLASFLHRPCNAGATMRRFVVPARDVDVPPAAVQLYMECTWRDDNMSLLDFLRKSNKKGEISKHIRQRFATESMHEESLEAFANRCECRGDTIIAAVHSSRFSDKFFKEWLVLHVPFRALVQLWREEVTLVPENYHGIALALLHDPGFWRDEMQVKADLELHAMRDEFVESNLAMVAAHTEIVDSYLSGELVLGRDEPPVRRVTSDVPNLPQHLHPEQWRVVDAIRRKYTQAIAEAWSEHGLTPPGQPVRHNEPLAVLGPAGSGKSTAVQVAVAEAAEAGARVVIACPTRMLVANLRQKLPGLDIDSIHAVFQLHKLEQQTLDSMVNFDLVVIEEVSMVDKDMFERLLRLWDAAGRRPALVFVGDFAQLRGVNPTRATDSLRWREVSRLHLHTMRRCKCAELRWKLELLRTAKPDIKQLRGILKGHKAPSRPLRKGKEMTDEPTAEDIANILMETPQTTFVTISRAATAWVNKTALDALFPRVPAMRCAG